MSNNSVLITGATGLLGNNLVREAIAQGFHVKAVVRNIDKAHQQFKDIIEHELAKPNLELIQGDMDSIATIAQHFKGVDAVFHTAAYFRDSYKGGTHWDILYQTNVVGTRNILKVAYDNGVRNFIHTSSIATLARFKDRGITEKDLADENNVDDYYRSKILSDKEVFEFAKAHPDFNFRFVLPGWMHGPGDLGPTSAGQVVRDFLLQKIPAIPPGDFSIVDARDVAKIIILAYQKGRNGERYLAAGREITMSDLLSRLEKISGVKAPTFHAPIPLLYVIATLSEINAKLFKKEALISFASLKLLLREKGVMNFDHTKTRTELGFDFRPVDDTLIDEIDWIRKSGIA